MTIQRGLLARWSVRQKLNRVSTVQYSYVALYTTLTTRHECMIANKTVGYNECGHGTRTRL